MGFRQEKLEGVRARLAWIATRRAAVLLAGVGLLGTLLAGALLLIGGAWPSFLRARPTVVPEHLLLVTFENVRADHCSAWQYARPTTFIPRADDQRALDLDHLAETGVAFANAFAPSGSALPSLGTLMTGTVPVEHGLVGGGSSLEEGIRTLAQELSAAGFVSVAFLAPSMSLSGTGLERGFSIFEEHGDVLDALRAGVAWLDSAGDPERPHFAWVHIGDPAWPWEPTPLAGRDGDIDFARLYLDPTYRGSISGGLEFLEALRRGERTITPEDRDALIAVYDGEIARANVAMRQFLEYYKHRYFDQDLWNRTLVVVVAASGMELGERGHWGAEGSLFDEGLHVPLVLRHPPSLTGRRILAEVVELADVPPTILEWFGHTPPRTVTGRALSPLFASTDKRSFESRPAVASRSSSVYTARDGRWRLLWNPEGVAPTPGEYPVREVELYDLVRDPRALRDVSAERPAEVEALRGVLEQRLQVGERAP